MLPIFAMIPSVYFAHMLYTPMFSTDDNGARIKGDTNMSEMDAYIEKAIDQFRSGKRRSSDKTICQGIERVIAAIAKEMHGSESSSISHLVHYTGMDVVFAMLN